MQKLRIGTIAKSVLGRVCNPIHVLKATRLQLARKRNRRSFDDAQLRLYAEMLPQGFLHFGYFDDPEIAPERISVGDIVDAQHRYAEHLLEHVIDREHPVLDVGCGMGGLTGMLLERGFCPTALSPDRSQVAHISATYPSVQVIRSKFEELDALANHHRFGTVITAESLQYLKLERALSHMQTILRPGGRWVACDFFYSQPTDEHSCHQWTEFVAALARTGWRISYQQDITKNVLPTLKFVHMWGVRLGAPLMDFALIKLRKKQPGIHYLAEDALSKVKGAALEQIASIDPAEFSKKHRYMLVVIERM